MSEAHEENLHNNLAFWNRKFKNLSENTDELYLTIEELKKIEQVTCQNTLKDITLQEIYL